MKLKRNKILKWFTIVMILFILFLFIINFYVQFSVKNEIILENDISGITDVDAILVLGAAPWGLKPSPMLEDRLKTAIFLYEKGVSSKILMSGDHTKENYDEVNVMKNYAIEEGVSTEDIFMDHAGISTYDSIYRAKNIFGIKKVVIVTQEYHLYRALYIAKSLGLEAYGVKAIPNTYSGQWKREIREILARDKDFMKCLLKPKSTYLGEYISINGDGNITNDPYSYVFGY